MTSANLLAESRSSETTGMLRSLKVLRGYTISAKDGHMGHIHDFFFDDTLWIVRYGVVDTGRWLPGRKVLLSPGVLLDPNWREQSFSVGLTREQVRTSPDIDTDKPVSRQHQVELHSHYGWPYYWIGEGGVVPIPPIALPPSRPEADKKSGDPHLRSVREIIGYGVEASDGDIGKVDDVIADDATWAVRYLVVATHKWLPGRRVLISPQWLVGPISWAARSVKIILSRENIKNSPKFDPATPVNREYEARLYDFYGRPQYWNEPRAAENQTKSHVIPKSPMKTAELPKSKSHRHNGKSQNSGQVVHFEFEDPTAHKVCLAGTFNNWKADKGEMTRLGNGKWAKDLNLSPGTYEYRMVVDGHWKPDPNADHTILNPFGERNSLLTVSK